MQMDSNASSNERDRQQCYRCGGTQHRAADCCFKDFECRFCHKKGHLEKVCFAKNQLTPQARSNRRPRRRPRNRYKCVTRRMTNKLPRHRVTRRKPRLIPFSTRQDTTVLSRRGHWPLQRRLKCSQLNKEALAIIFGVKKFHHYLYGRRFTILSDHKPLKYLFDYNCPIPAMASARIERWALTLSAYQYEIEYKPGSEHANADVFSRLPLAEAPKTVPLPGDTVLLMEALHTLPVTVAEVKQWTDHDPLLSAALKMALQGWKPTEEEQMRPFYQRLNELSVHDGCVLCGNRVIVPPAGQTRVLEELHQGHPGTSRMKAPARNVVWWPKMDSDIVAKVKQCFSCQEHQKTPPAAPLHPWDWPNRPWARVHVDHAGPFLGKTFLILVDAHSKWLEVIPVASTSSQATIQALHRVFATHGLPEMLVSDNGTAFTSEQFTQFLRVNGIRPVNAAPYHPYTHRPRPL